MIGKHCSSELHPNDPLLKEEQLQNATTKQQF